MTQKKPSEKGGKKQEKVSPGRTVKTKDKYLPTDKKGKSGKPKEKRWIAVIAVNDKGELGVVRLTTEKQANTTKLPSYKHGNGKTTYFKHFVEIEDDKGNPIKIDGVKFIENPKKYDLTKAEVKKIEGVVLNHSRQAPENRKKLSDLKNKKSPRN